MDTATYGWIAWVVAFLGLEAKALISKEAGDTLSEHVWKWFMVRDPRNTPATLGLRGVLLAFLVWLTGHLGFGIWTL
jgi:hypothetical protein